jgi:hypothetical protein
VAEIAATSGVSNNNSSEEKSQEHSSVVGWFVEEQHRVECGMSGRDEKNMIN